MGGQLYPLAIEPGIQRDGTPFKSRKWIDGQWVRFYMGDPRKIGGYSQVDNSHPDPARGMIIIPVSPYFNIYTGFYDSLKYFPIDSSGNYIGPVIDRTPALFNQNINNEWQFDIMFDANGNSSILIAFAGQNLNSIDSDVPSPIYYGNSTGTDALIQTGLSTAGGMVVLHPYLFIYDSNGLISWTQANNPTSIMGTARVTASKIIYGAPTRGGNSSPAGLFWSLDSLIRATFTGQPEVFTFDSVTNQSSILSNKCVVQYDDTYYWAGTDRFLLYNGIVQELPNDTNLDYFFKNLNYSQRQKVWATKISKWGEIWWFFPIGTSTECNGAVIYNIRERTWSNTLISRCCGDFDQTFQYPVWADNVKDPNTTNYPIWVHEIGVDKNVNGNLTPIQSYIQSANLAWCAVGPDRKFDGIDRWVELYRFEPDFIQQGTMTIQVNGKTYANAPVVSSTPQAFTSSTEKIDFREQRRQMTLRFESNTVGGFYQMGQILLVMRVGDARQ
jgi:hypothetical protein